MCFICWIIYLMNIQNTEIKQYVQFTFLGMVLIFQEKYPWHVIKGTLPIGICACVLLIRYALYHPIPTFKYRELSLGLFFLSCGLWCFARGLDDENDPFRFFHGCWHAFVGISAYYNVQVLTTESTILPLKRT